MKCPFIIQLLFPLFSSLLFSSTSWLCYKKYIFINKNYDRTTRKANVFASAAAVVVIATTSTSTVVFKE